MVWLLKLGIVVDSAEVLQPSVSDEGAKNEQEMRLVCCGQAGAPPVCLLLLSSPRVTVAQHVIVLQEPPLMGHVMVGQDPHPLTQSPFTLTDCICTVRFCSLLECSSP